MLKISQQKYFHLTSKFRGVKNENFTLNFDDNFYRVKAFWSADAAECFRGEYLHLCDWRVLLWIKKRLWKLKNSTFSSKISLFCRCWGVWWVNRQSKFQGLKIIYFNGFKAFKFQFSANQQAAASYQISFRPKIVPVSTGEAPGNV